MLKLENTAPNVQLPTFTKAHRLLHIHKNVSGVVAEITNVLFKHNINIVGQKPQALEERLNLLLVQNISKDKSPKTATLQRSLIKHRSSIFPFLYEEKLSADNNASERSIRNLKVKMKVSGLFKTGQSVYAVLKSITETIKKKGQSIFQAFCLLANSEYHLMDTE
ncbi:MAG: putative amino acid-binding ACT domain protein [Flammeovirgaceae bacterium]|jgi:predicted amino acid-binding ACT domain protein